MPPVVVVSGFVQRRPGDEFGRSDTIDTVPETGRDHHPLSWQL